VQSRHFIPYLWLSMDSGQGGLSVGGAGGWSCHGLDQGGEKGEETEGMMGTCSPRAGGVRGERPDGGEFGWPVAVLGGGGAPVID
jgi:hypothetical protein